MIRAFLAASLLPAAVVAILAAAPIVAQERSPERTKELSRAETEARVKADAARRFKLDAGDIAVVASADRVWPDAGLGCQARRGVLGSEPVSGFLIVVEANGRRFPYHTDRHGRVRVCLAPPKPLDPIR